MRKQHLFGFILSFGMLLFLYSCVTEETIINTEEPIAVELPNQNGVGIVQQKSLTGSFQSVEGVMDRLSCFCSHGGYVTTEDGERIAVCFDETVESCPKITITGYQTSKKINDNGACTEGMMSYVKVQSYIIGETKF